MKLRRLTALFLSAVTAVTAISMPAGTAYAASEEWSNDGAGTYTYTHGTNPTVQPPWLDVDIADVDWSTIKYVSADVTVNGTAAPAFGGAIGEDWYNCDTKTIDNDTATIYLEPDGKVFNSLEINFGQISDCNYTTAGAEISISNIVFSTEERDYSDVTGEWYEQNGSWHYTHGSDSSQNPRELDLLSLKPESIAWTDVKYVSADITANNAAFPVIGGNLTGNDGDWTTGSEKMLSEAGTVTAYLNTNGAEPTGLCVEFWHVDWDNNFAIEAGTNITVSNINFSTEERDYSNIIGEWYSPEGGIWCYRNGDTDVTEIPCLNFDYSSVSDWSSVKYVSAKVQVDGKAVPVIGGSNNGKWIDGSAVYTENDSTVVFLYTEGGEFSDLNVNFFSIPESSYAVTANTVITVSEITFAETYPTDYTGITGQWIKTADGYYYNHGNKSNIAYVEGLVLDCPYDMADVQSISITAKVAMTGGTPKSIKLTVAGVDANGAWHPGYNFPFGAVEQTIVRKYRGCITERPSLDISFGQEDLVVIENGGSIEIYVSDITFSTDPINIIYSTPNDLLIDDNESEITGDNEHDIMYQDISKIEKTGTLKIFTENLGGAQNINVFWREWSDFSNITTLETQPVAVGDGVYEIRVTEDVLKIIHEKAPNKCELALTGTGYKFLMATFTPEPDAPMPVPEEINPDAITDMNKAQLEQSKDNTIDETKAPESAEDMEYGKAHGHKSGRKKHKDGHYMYALRIVQRVEKKDLQHAKSITITVYSKKANQYITLTADTCFSYLNINGFKVKANNKDAFLTVVLDNIPEDDEITFTSFTINYKK